MNPPASEDAPLSVKLGALAVIAVLLVGMVGAAEWYVRRRAEAKYGFADVDRLSCFDEKIKTFVLCPSISAGPLHSNVLGFRGPEIVEPRPAGTIRVAFLGGSTTLAIEASSDEKTWSQQTVERLKAAFPAAQFDHVNAGVAGHTLADMTKNWARVAPLRPDIVVLYEGTNDLSLDTRKLAKAAGILSEDPDKPSWLADRSMLYKLVEKNVRILARGKVAPSAVLTYDADATSQGFKARYVSLVETIKTAGVPVVAVVTFSPRIRATQSPGEQDAAMVTTRYYAPYLDEGGAIRGFTAYNARVREVAAETGALLIDGEDRIPGDGLHFTDSVHLADAGLTKQAERVAEALIAAPAVRALVATSTAAAR